MQVKRASQEEKSLVRKSKDIEERLFSLPELKKSKAVMFYIAKSDEVRTEDMIRRLLRMDKQVIVPSLRQDKNRIMPSIIFDYDTDLEEGTFGIMEPRVEHIRKFPIEDIDIFLVPGVAFDKAGGRLGFGGGFYDRFLSELSQNAKCWGLAFEFQLIEKLPLTERDIPVQKIITEERIVSPDLPLYGKV